MMQEIKIHNEQTPRPKQRSKFFSYLRNKADVADFLFALWKEKCKERLRTGQTPILAGGFKDGTKPVRVNCNEHVRLDSYSSDHEEADSRIFFHVIKATEMYAPKKNNYLEH